PAWRWAEVRAGIPIGTEFVVFLTFGGVAQNFVGFVDFFEFFLGLLFVFGNVGMIFASQLAKGFLDIGVARGAGDTENFVIVFILNGHSCFAWHGQISGRAGEKMPVLRRLSKTVVKAPNTQIPNTQESQFSTVAADVRRLYSNRRRSHRSQMEPPHVGCYI